jgi:hypothetical protein
LESGFSEADMLQTRKFFALPYEDKMIAKHPPKANPNRGYCYVGQESISTISGYEKGLPQGKFVRDIKVSFYPA